jgi:hypothetical protein
MQNMKNKNKKVRTEFNENPPPTYERSPTRHQTGQGTRTFNGRDVIIKYDKEDQQGKTVFNERNPTRPSNKK